MPAPPDSGLESILTQSVIDPLIELGQSLLPKATDTSGPSIRKTPTITENVRSKILELMQADHPVARAAGETVRVLTTPENLGIMGGIAAANLTPAGPYVDVAVGLHFSKQMAQSSIQYYDEHTDAAAKASEFRKAGNKEEAAKWDSKADYFAAHSVIAGIGAALPVAHLGFKGAKLGGELGEALAERSGMAPSDRFASMKDAVKVRTAATEETIKTGEARESGLQATAVRQNQAQRRATTEVPESATPEQLSAEQEAQAPKAAVTAPVQAQETPVVPLAKPAIAEVIPPAESAVAAQPEPAAKVPTPDVQPAAELPSDVTFRGKQEGYGSRPGVDLYNLKVQGGEDATFAVRAGQSVVEAADKKRAEFGLPAKETAPPAAEVAPEPVAEPPATTPKVNPERPDEQLDDDITYQGSWGPGHDSYDLKLPDGSKATFSVLEGMTVAEQAAKVRAKWGLPAKETALEKRPETAPTTITPDIVDMVRDKIKTNWGGPSGVLAAYSPARLREILELPPDSSLRHLEKAGLVAKNDEGLYEFADVIRDTYRDATPKPATELSESPSGQFRALKEANPPTPESVTDEIIQRKLGTEVTPSRLRLEKVTGTEPLLLDRSGRMTKGSVSDHQQLLGDLYPNRHLDDALKDGRLVRITTGDGEAGIDFKEAPSLEAMDALKEIVKGNPKTRWALDFGDGKGDTYTNPIDAIYDHYPELNRPPKSPSSLFRELKAHADAETMIADESTRQMTEWAEDAQSTKFKRGNKSELDNVGQTEGQNLNYEGHVDLRDQFKKGLFKSSGTKEGTALDGFKQGPAELSEAIGKGKGKLFDRIKAAFDNRVRDTVGEQIVESVRKDSGALQFPEGESAPLMGGNRAEAQQMAKDLNAERMVKSEDFRNQQTARTFDETRLVNSELFGGKGGRQGSLTPTDADLERQGIQSEQTSQGDTSFDFGEPPAVDLPTGEPNFSERMDRKIADTKGDIQRITKSLAEGSSLSAGIPTDLIEAYVKLGAYHLAKGINEFGEWSRQMIEDIGEAARPHLERLYQLSQESLAKSRPPQIESVESASAKYGVLGGAARSIADTFRKVRDYGTLDPVPNLSRAGVQEQAVNHAYARIAVPRMINDLLSKVFPENYKDTASMAKTMRVMVLDNILGGYDELKARGAQAAQGGDKSGVTRFGKLVSNVERQHDLPAYETEVRAAQADPQVSAAIGRWKETVNPVMDQLYNEMKGMDPDTVRDGRGRIFGARVNLLAKSHEPDWLKATTKDDAPLPAHPAPSLSSYRNPNVRQDRFDRMAKLTGAEYSDDPVAVLAAALFPRWNEVTKRRLYNGLVEKGWASWEKPEGGTIHNQEVRGAPVDIPETKDGETRIQRHTLWLPKDLHEEFRGVLGTDLPLKPSAVSAALTKIQLAQLADATSHLKNIHSVIAGAQGTKALWTDVARKMPGISTADSFSRIGKVMYDIAQDTPAIRSELADMAKQGMLRQHFPATGIQRITKMQDLIHSVDTASRVVMNRFYENLINRGLAKDTFESRREFVQQIGEYNKRLVGPLQRAASQSGLAPFIVAGRNFNRYSRRLLTGDAGFEPSSNAAMLQARLVNFTSLGTMFTLPMMLNKLTSGSIWGQPGTPIGAIDLGKEDASGNHKVLDLLQLYGVRRGMRAVGLDSIAEGLKNGDSADDIVGKAIYGATSTAAHPWLGPALGFLFQSATGQRLDLRGGPSPEQASKMDNMGSQLGENVRAALKNQNLLIYSPLRKAFNDVDQSPMKDFASDFLKAPAAAVGIGNRTSPALQEARSTITHMQTSPEQKARSQIRHDILTKYDAGETADANKLLTESLKSGKLAPRDVVTINSNKRKSPLERALASASLEEVLNVWDKASADEKKKLRPMLSTRMASQALTAEQRAILIPKARTALAEKAP